MYYQLFFYIYYSKFVVLVCWGKSVCREELLTNYRYNSTVVEFSCKILAMGIYVLKL